MIRALLLALLILPLVWSLEWFSRMDEEELYDRSRDGSATPRWAVEVRMQINRRQARIDALRSRLPSITFGNWKRA